MIEMQSRTFSYLSGLPDREFQEKVWRTWANAVNRVFDRAGVRMKPQGLRFTGKAYAVLSFIAELQSFVDFGEELPFQEWYVPQNLLTWPGSLANEQVSSSLEFYWKLLEMFGVEACDLFLDDHLVVLVDPHLMDEADLGSLVKEVRGKQVAVLNEASRPLPKVLRQLMFDGVTDVQLLPWDTIGPLVLPQARDIVRNSNTQGIVLAGAGRRLPIAAMQAADLQLLFRTDPAFKYADRVNAVNDCVIVHQDYAAFTDVHYQIPRTMREALLLYLDAEFGCTTHPVPDDQVNLQELDLEFLVRGHLVPV